MKIKEFNNCYSQVDSRLEFVKTSYNKIFSEKIKSKSYDNPFTMVKESKKQFSKKFTLLYIVFYLLIDLLGFAFFAQQSIFLPLIVFKIIAFFYGLCSGSFKAYGDVISNLIPVLYMIYNKEGLSCEHSHMYYSIEHNGCHGLFALFSLSPFVWFMHILMYLSEEIIYTVEQACESRKDIEGYSKLKIDNYEKIIEYNKELVELNNNLEDELSYLKLQMINQSKGE